ncbi:MAG: hypothetical protein Q8K72_00480, partial [Acidimicrobiales bacterium]|nr:hypothetical protein [Acidimicrobiales bacterium]
MSLPAAIERSAAPAAVRLALQRLGETQPQVLDRLAGDDRLREAFVAVTAASRSLTELVLTDPAAVEVLADLERRPAAGDDVPRWKRLELLRIAARDLLGIDDLPAVGAGLARMAGDVHAAAAPSDGLAVIAM